VSTAIYGCSQFNQHFQATSPCAEKLKTQAMNTETLMLMKLAPAVAKSLIPIIVRYIN